MPTSDDNENKNKNNDGNNNDNDENNNEQQDGGNKRSSNASESATNQKPAPTWLAWTVRGVSLAIVLALLGYFINAAIQPKQHPVFEFTVKNEMIEQRGTGWVVPVNVCNKGTMSVHALRVKATLSEHPEQLEEVADILLLGPGETVTASFWYADDPREKGLELSVGRYLLP